MSKKSLRGHIVHFYQSRSLADRKAQRLVRMTQGPEEKEESLMYSSATTWRPATWMGLTATAALLLVAAGLFLRPGGPGLGNAPHEPAPVLPAAAAAPDAAGLPTPQLVAVKIQADWCTRSPDVAPIFDELTTKYGNQPILFVTLDITDETGRLQARYMADNLGIGEVYNEPFESGMVKLIDRKNGRVLAVLTGEEDQPAMEGALAQALPPRP